MVVAYSSPFLSERSSTSLLWCLLHSSAIPPVVVNTKGVTYATPLVFTSTGGMAEECRRYHSRLAELLADKKGEEFATMILVDPDKGLLRNLEISPSRP